MFLRFLRIYGFLFICLSAAGQTKPVLRVAADPNNLPFSNDRLEGYENRLAALIAKDLGMDLQYVWHAQRRGFFRETLKEGRADLVLSVPAGFDMALTTQPYYRSTYVFVSPQAVAPLSSFDDPVLRTMRIGVQLIGDDGADTPPAHALARRGLITNVVGFTVYGDYKEENPPARIMDAFKTGDIDCAVVWGPLAGYFGKRASVPLRLVPVNPASEPPLRFAFSVAMGVRKGDKALQGHLNDIIVRRAAEIHSILDEYGVPQLELLPSKSGQKLPH